MMHKTPNEAGMMAKRAMKGGRDGTQSYINQGKMATGMKQPGWSAAEIQKGFKCQSVAPSKPMGNGNGMGKMKRHSMKGGY